MRSAVLALLAGFCLVAAVCTIGARVDFVDNTPLDWQVVAEQAAAVDPSRRHDVAIFTFKLTVPPAVASEFVDKWDQYIGAPASKAKGNLKVALSRPIISNAIYYDYSEWETMEDFADWYKGKNSKDFRDYTADRDIAWEWEVLRESTGSHTERGRITAESGRKDKSFSVLSTILVKPHHVDTFINEWRKVAQETADEDGLDTYTLHRVASTNSKFYLYGTWSSESAWKDHLDSDYVHDFANWADKHDIIFVESPLRALSNY